MTDDRPINLVVMLEEESAKYMLDVLLPKILPACVRFLCIPHQGKSHLQKSIPIKLRAWRKPRPFFVILHDQDSHDCIALKNQLQQLCASASQHSPLIRIACRELEAWYFGDLDAVQQAFPDFIAARYRNKSKFRNPDSIVNPGYELGKIVPNFTKGYAAREVSKYMNIDNNTSASFKHTIASIRNLVEAPK